MSRLFQSVRSITSVLRHPQDALLMADGKFLVQRDQPGLFVVQELLVELFQVLFAGLQFGSLSRRTAAVDLASTAAWPLVGW